jgi:hypothetical protein
VQVRWDKGKTKQNKKKTMEIENMITGYYVTYQTMVRWNGYVP